jgi:hypothetical protein
MSRSNQNNNNSGNANPCKYFIDWKNGSFMYYDKEAGKNVDLGDKITFLVLDQLTTIKGWHDASESGIWSNEVRDTRIEPLKIRAFKVKDDLLNGIYGEIKDKINSLGARYIRSMYVAMKVDGDTLELANLQLKGATLGEWTSFFNDNKNEIYDAAVEVKGSDERKKGSTKFKVPVFALKKVSEDTNETAKLLDTTLQEHLSGYLLGQDFEARKQVADKVLNEVVEDDLPF